MTLSLWGVLAPSDQQKIPPIRKAAGFQQGLRRLIRGHMHAWLRQGRAQVSWLQPSAQ